MPCGDLQFLLLAVRMPETITVSKVFHSIKKNRSKRGRLILGDLVNLLESVPKSVRNISARTRNKEKNRRLAKQFGYEYFDGTREQGYGGYVYDGRWQPVAQRIIDLFSLKPGDRVLDIGCAKGFLVADLLKVLPGLEVYGLDISQYAIDHCHEDAKGKLLRGNCDQLPFADNSFAVVMAINTIHNLDEEGCMRALREVERIAPGRGFVQIDAYRNDDEREIFLDWMLTAETFLKPEDWQALFESAGYTGHYFWTILQTDGSVV